jgi:hypothetical protein
MQAALRSDAFADPRDSSLRFIGPGYDLHSLPVPKDKSGELKKKARGRTSASFFHKTWQQRLVILSQKEQFITYVDDKKG